jgi:hypothetical protein
MDNQKRNEEQTGKPHGKFFADGRSEEGFPGHIEQVSLEMAQKYVRKHHKLLFD